MLLGLPAAIGVRRTLLSPNVRRSLLIPLQISSGGQNFNLKGGDDAQVRAAICQRQGVQQGVGVAVAMGSFFLSSARMSRALGGRVMGEKKLESAQGLSSSRSGASRGSKGHDVFFLVSTTGR